MGLKPLVSRSDRTTTDLNMRRKRKRSCNAEKAKSTKRTDKSKSPVPPKRRRQDRAEGNSLRKEQSCTTRTSKSYVLKSESDSRNVKHRSDIHRIGSPRTHITGDQIKSDLVPFVNLCPKQSDCKSSLASGEGNSNQEIEQSVAVVACRTKHRNPNFVYKNTKLAASVDVDHLENHTRRNVDIITQTLSPNCDGNNPPAPSVNKDQKISARKTKQDDQLKVNTKGNSPPRIDKDVFTHVLATVCLEALGIEPIGTVHATVRRAVCGTGVKVISSKHDIVLEGQWNNLAEARARLLQLHDSGLSGGEISSTEPSAPSVRAAYSEHDNKNQEECPLVSASVNPGIKGKETDLKIEHGCSVTGTESVSSCENIAEDYINRDELETEDTDGPLCFKSDSPEHRETASDESVVNPTSKKKSIPQNAENCLASDETEVDLELDLNDSVVLPESGDSQLPGQSMVTSFLEEEQKISKKYDGYHLLKKALTQDIDSVGKHQVISSSKASKRHGELECNPSTKMPSVLKETDSAVMTTKSALSLENKTSKGNHGNNSKTPSHEIKTEVETCIPSGHGRFQCEFCTSSFKTKQQKYTHKQKVHKTYVNKGSGKVTSLQAKAAQRSKLNQDVGKIVLHLDFVTVDNADSCLTSSDKTDDSVHGGTGKTSVLEVTEVDGDSNPGQEMSSKAVSITNSAESPDVELALDDQENDKTPRTSGISESMPHKQDKDEKLDQELMSGTASTQVGNNLTNLITLPKQLSYNCKLCHCKYPNLEEFLDHSCKSSDLAKSICLPAILKCPHCDFSCKRVRPWSFLTHFKKHTKPAVYKCATCTFSCEKKTRIASHLMNAHGKRSYVCDICQKTFTSCTLLNHHKAVTHSKQEPKHLCYKCGALFVSSLALSRHKFRCRGAKPEKEVTAQYPALSRRDDDLFHCPVCDWKHTARNEVWRHMRRRHREAITTYKCEHCGLFLANEVTYTAHVKAQHMDTETNTLKNKTEVRYQCSLCNKISNSEYNLKKHIRRVHENEVNHYCDICGKGFFQHNRMLEHKRRHLPKEEQLKIASFSCNVCHKVFTSKRYRNLHEKMYHDQQTAERYSCNECNRSFPWQFLLEQHAVSHGVIKPARCERCGKLFQHPHLVRKHMRKVHKEYIQPSLGRNVPSARKQSVCRSGESDQDRTLPTKELNQQQSQKYQLANPEINFSEEAVHILDSFSNSEAIVTGDGTEDTMTVVHIISSEEVNDLTGNITVDGSTSPVVLALAPDQVLQPVDGDLMLQPIEEAPAHTDTLVTAEDGIVLNTGDAIVMNTEVKIEGELDHDEMYWCKECNLLFSTLDEAEAHVATQHSEDGGEQL